MARKVDYVLNDNDLVFVANAKREDFLGKYSFVGLKKEYSFDSFSAIKKNQIFRLLHLDINILKYNKYTTSEKKRLNLAYYLLKKKQVLVIDHLFDNLDKNEIKYFMRLFREFNKKRKIKIVLLEDDMNIICEYSKKFYLYHDKDFHLIQNYYDDIIYEYVEMPYTVKLIKYFEKHGHKVDHEITFDETLKAIYRSIR